MMFWNIKSKEYVEIKRELSLIWIEIDAMAMRYKRKVKKVELPEETEGSGGFDDGFDELRKLNKDVKS